MPSSAIWMHRSAGSWPTWRRAPAAAASCSTSATPANRASGCWPSSSRARASRPSPWTVWLEERLIGGAGRLNGILHRVSLQRMVAVTTLAAVALAREDRAFPLGVRMGMHCGDVTPRGDDFVGRTVNVAARITDLAGPGELVVSDGIVAAIEGHGDNAGAAVYGGLVAVADGTLRHLELAPELRFVFGIPDEPLKTTKARHALPDEISREAAARNVARMAFLLEGLRTADPAAFAHSGGDEIHESHRAPLSPVTGRLMEEARAAGALHAAWSGAGPTAVAVTLEPEPVVAAMQAVLGNRGRALVLDVAAAGWG